VVVHSLTFSLGRGDTCAAFLSLAAGYAGPLITSLACSGRLGAMLARGLPRPCRRFGARTSLAGNF